MRHLFFLAALPLVAAPQPKSKIRPKVLKVTVLEASITWGSGVEPKGVVPPATFDAKVVIEGLLATSKPELRAWRMLTSDLPALTEGAQLRFVRGGLGRLSAKTTETVKGTWTLQGEWPATPKADEQLVVEVWVGGRRVGYGISPLTERALPGGRPRNREAQE